MAEKPVVVVPHLCGYARVDGVPFHLVVAVDGEAGKWSRALDLRAAVKALCGGTIPQGPTAALVELAIAKVVRETTAGKDEAKFREAIAKRLAHWEAGRWEAESTTKAKVELTDAEALDCEVDAIAKGLFANAATRKDRELSAIREAVKTGRTKDRKVYDALVKHFEAAIKAAKKSKLKDKQVALTTPAAGF